MQKKLLRANVLSKNIEGYTVVAIILALNFFLLLCLFLYLSRCVISNRYQHKVAYTQVVKERYFQATISAHRNFVDYVPLSLIAFLMLKQQHAPMWLLLLLTTLLCVGRYTHALGLLVFEQKENPLFIYRKIGMICTFLTLILASVALLVLALA